ncbi:hypothetical protein PENTCL1PPCAC_12855 [Pristionchus entomophagus]|uniref:C-type lectin domain-containing protein n=1 Tax=Pristionchus entomophagus TaxID=358040 RepID=A0AAV5T580_9BILA|nr:hypothetical protein PENTCL1PPCAC_12855 [Pristionchus entomophagus]
MLMLLVLLYAINNVHSSCPSGWELVREGECRGRAVNSASLYYDELADNAVAKCQALQANPLIIHDSEHQSYWASKRASSSSSLTCNTATKRWVWANGSSLDFKPSSSNYDKELDAERNAGCAWFIYDSSGHWSQRCGHSTNGFDIWCTSLMEKPDMKECDNFNNDSEDSACYQIGTTAKNWQDAQIACRNYGADLASIHNIQENSFIRRLAVSKGTVNGVFLGATLSGKGTGFGWIDGTEWDYENFYPGFPIDGLGDCLSMDTLGVNGQWMNMDCSSKLAVACVRQQNTSYVDECSAGPWKEGQIIYSPGYPYDATLPCDYFLTVDAGKRVEVKIQLLEANTCCDHLILTDSYLAGNIVAKV